MLGKILGLFLQPKTQKTIEKSKEMYHFILFYTNENGHSCIFRTYATTYQGAKSELLRQYEGKKISNICLKSKNLQ